ncbi:hypothetical protein D3C75_1149430 [compost metagenome]
MRIDLALQRLQLRLLLLLLNPVDILNELPDTRQHAVELMAQQSDLIPAFNPESHIQIAVLHLFHQLDHLGQRLRQRKRENHRNNQRQHDNNQGRGEGSITGQLHPACQFIDRNRNDDVPVCFGRT